MKGAGGLRKTSLAQKVFHDLRIVYHFDTRAWVNCESSTDQVLSNLLHSVALSYDESDDDRRDLLRRFPMDKYMSIEDKGDLLRRSLMGKRYLIVVDRLCNFEAWNQVGRYLPPDNVGSCILLTSALGDERSLDVSLEDYMVGRYDCMKDIIKELTRPPSASALTTVTITGMGGIGKTTLAKYVCNHPKIVHRFHPLAWVNSVSSFDQVLSHLLESIAVSGDEFHGQSKEDKGETLCKRLKTKRYLIVVDDLWNFQAWNSIERYLPDDKVGSRILITSRFMAFPTIIPKNSPHCIGPFDENQSWELLEMLVFGEEESCPSELEVVGKQIAERCGRLPLAISVLAGTLSSIPRSYSSWSSVMESVNSSIVSVKPEECLDILALSYNYLPHHLKPCFLFMAAFPAHREIEVRKLINLWIAAGLILDSKSSKPSEKVAEDYLEDLIRRSLVSVGKRSFDGRMRTCLIHDLLRQLCLREAQKENFLHVLEEAHSNAQVLEKQRHLIFNSDSFDDFHWLPPLPHLRSFTWLNLGSDFRRGMVLLQLIGFKWLRVLDMYLLAFYTLPVQILSLVNLRYLGLSATDVLDASISQLWKLQTLIAYGPWITRRGEGNLTILLEIWKMPWLRQVNISMPTYLRYPSLLPPLPDGSLIASNLQTLSTITFSSCTEQVLSLMPNLKKLAVYETKEDYENCESANCFQNLASLTGLEILKCFFHKGNGKAKKFRLGCFAV